MFYEIHYAHFVENQNARNAKIRHTERNRTIEDLLAAVRKPARKKPSTSSERWTNTHRWKTWFECRDRVYVRSFMS